MSPSVVPGLGVDLAYERRGAGPPVLLVHGMAGAKECWDGLARELRDRATVIAYDRRGYGASTAPEPYERTTIEEQAEDAAALLARLDAAPAVVCGRDLGAVVCLDLVKRHPAAVRAAVLVDPALYQLAPAATEALSAERVALEQAVRDGGPGGGVEAWLEGRGAELERIARAREDAGAFFADYAGLASWPILGRELRAFDVPLAVLASAAAPGYAREVAEALAELVGVDVRDAGELVSVLLRLI
jgi:pimeloyl-ACP methyl ester carboxylesterase